MGNISFNIPESLDKTWEKELLKSYFLGGPDSMPFFFQRLQKQEYFIT